MSYLEKYFEKVIPDKRTKKAIAFFASLDAVSEVSSDVAKSILKELIDQKTSLKLIASENYSSLSTQLAMGNLLTDKYSEGTVKHRFYSGCENVDDVEEIAIEQAKKLFNAEHAYVQPHSGADANLIAFWAILTKNIENKEIEKLSKKNALELTDEEYEKIRQLLVNQKVFGMSLASGGHLTHGFRMNVSSKFMKAYSYSVDPKTGLIDYDDLSKKIKEIKPLIFLVGYSSYPRRLNFKKLKEIAKSVNAVLMVDMAHFAGLVAGKVLKDEFDPVKYADIVTSTTHKTLRGPRGGVILCTEEYKDFVDKGCPLVIGGPLPHIIAAKAIAFIEANDLSFQNYAAQIVKNAKALAMSLMEKNIKILTDGTDNHLVIIDVDTSFGLTGRQAEKALKLSKMTTNRNSIPNDKNGAWFTSGIRLGTPALTTRGFKEEEMKKVAEIIFDILKNVKPKIDPKTNKPSKANIEIDQEIILKNQNIIKKMLDKFELYPELVI